MPSETETLALHLVRALYDATDGRPQEWRLEELDERPQTRSSSLPREDEWSFKPAIPSALRTPAGVW
jgi:hypothetical protein